MQKKIKFNFNWFSIAVLLLAILIVILAIVSAVKIFEGYTEFVNGPDTILNAVNRHDYAYAVEDAYHDRALGKNGEAYKTPYAAVDYLNAAVLYNAYTKAEDTKKAEAQKAEMDSAFDEMGQLASKLAKDVDAMFAGD